MKIVYIIILALLVIGYFYFSDVKVASPVDQLSINNPKDLEEVSEIVKVEGESILEKDVYYKIDNSEWVKATGIKKWNFILDTDKLDKGTHIIYIKSGETTKAIRINVI